MNVFCDHVGHYSLANSLVELFVNRLGYNLFFPQLVSNHEFDGLYTPDCDMHTDMRINWDEFKSMKFDLMVSTILQTEPIMHKLQKQYHPKAKIIRQLYNVRELPTPESTNILLGCDHDSLISGKRNIIKYTPEHDHDFDNIGLNANKEGIFLYRSYFHYIAETSSTTDFNSISRLTKNQLKTPEMTFNGLKRKNIKTDLIEAGNKQFLVDCIKKYQMYFHPKQNGSCGFTPREILFAGLPLIVNNWHSRFHKTRSQNFFIDGKNCIDIDFERRDTSKSVDLIIEWLQPDVYLQKCKYAVEFSKNIIDYKYEASEIKEWIENLL